MTNNQVVINFLNGKDAHSLNMRSENGKLYSYSTCIAEIVNRESGKKPILIVNKTKYSTTTSGKHQRPLYDNMSSSKYDIYEIMGVPMGAGSLMRLLKCY